MLRATLTTITLLIASQSLFAQEKKFSFYNARSLVNREWSCTYTMTKKDYSKKSNQYASTRTYNRRTRRYTTKYKPTPNPTYKSTSSTILSLKSGNSWGKGKAWILKVTQNGSNKNQTTYEAWKGFYSFYGDGDDEDNLILSLGFVRKYSGRKQQNRISWTLDTRYEKKGADLHIPLDEKTVPHKRVTLSVVKGYFVDSKGQRTILRDEPYGILQKLSGQGDIKTVYSTGFIGLGESVEMNDSSASTILSSTVLGKSLPTGCRLHLIK